MILYLFAEIRCHNCYLVFAWSKLKHSNILCYLTIRLAHHLCSSTPLVYICMYGLYVCPLSARGTFFFKKHCFLGLTPVYSETTALSKPYFILKLQSVRKHDHLISVQIMLLLLLLFYNFHAIHLNVDQINLIHWNSCHYAIHISHNPQDIIIITNIL